MYYLDPFNYLMSSLLVFTSWSATVTCKPSELAVFDPPSNQTCDEYLSLYKAGMGVDTNLLNPYALSSCEVCQFAEAAGYLRTFNIKEEYYGWRNAAIVVLFCCSSYAMVFLMMKLRTKATKRAS
jgi:ATP-binding cassette subfamily G (WHITE) protein 2 (SNQ2)